MIQTNPPEPTQPAPAASVPSDRFLSLPRVLDKTDRGRTATLDDVKAKRFPQPIKVGRRTLWLESEVDAWMVARVRAHRGQS